jgi:hypothetical protein
MSMKATRAPCAQTRHDGRANAAAATGDEHRPALRLGWIESFGESFKVCVSGSAVTLQNEYQLMP